MAEKFAVSQRPSLKTSPDELTSPILFLSSEEIGWDGLVARAYHEPMQAEGVIESAASIPHIPLVLFVRGAMYMEQRPVNGSWKGNLIRSGDLMLPLTGVCPANCAGRALLPNQRRPSISI